MTVDLGGHRQVQGIIFSKCDQHGHIIIKSSDKNISFPQLQARRVWRDYCMDVQVGSVSLFDITMFMGFVQLSMFVKLFCNYPCL